MTESERLQRRIEALEENLRLLHEENVSLTEAAEDTMLLSLIAQEIGSAETATDVLQFGLERVSLLKNISVCLFCRLGEQAAQVVEAFLSCSADDIRGSTVSLSPPVRRSLESGPVCLRGAACEQVNVSLGDSCMDFRPRSVLLIPVGQLADTQGLFVFVDDQDDDRLAAISMMLHRASDIISTRLDHLRLLGELTDLNVELERATRAKSQFLANMSHEIRTPMNAILGFSQLLSHDETLTREQRGRLDIINRNGEYLLDLINDVLEMSKIEAGRSTAELGVFDVHAALDDIDGAFRERVHAKGLAFHVERDASLPGAAVSDPRKIRQILVNLLANAAKFTDRGSVMLRASARVLSDDDVELCFEVKDTGLGIAEEEMPLLFGQFDQTRTGRSVGAGSGLGLAISREYARLLRGDIVASSQLGIGSTFTVTVIAQPADVSELPEIGTSRGIVALAPGQPQYKILIADDFAEMRELVADIFSRLGYEVRTASDGGQAVEVFDRWLPDLILMDLRMPIMDGHEAIRLIRASDHGDSTKIVALTASAFAEDRREAFSSGADEFIGKPCTEGELVETCGRLLGAEYRYDDDGRRVSRLPCAVMHPDMFARLPESVIEDLSDATAKADFRRVIELCDTVVSHIDSEIAQGLRRLAEEYDAETIMRLIESHSQPTDPT